MSNRDISYVKLLTEDSSFQLVRTNPKLTGNIKIAINDTGGLWLESIKANPELSKDVYSKFPIDIAQSHASNIFRFLNNGTTPNEIIFSLTEQVDLTKTSKDLKDQYDFSHYFSGAKYLASKKYPERMSYFAPLYLKKDVPDYFIVFKIDDPANFPLDQVKAKYESGESKTQYLIDLFSRASIIKTFDLRAETVPGKYLRDYVNSPNFPTSPLTVSYEESDFTTWNGIIVNEGTFGSKGELLDTLYSSSQPLKFFEENMTNGFSRNGVIMANILNLEFVFNDDSSEKYDFNRYLGLYVNAIELTKLDIDLDRSYNNRSTWENTPHFRKKFLETDDVIVTQTNDAGVIVPFKNSEVTFSEFNESFTDSETLFINYVSDKDGRLYMPNLTNGTESKYSNSIECTLSSSGTSVFAEVANGHGYTTGDLITVISSESKFSGEFPITVITDSTFTYSILTSLTAEANGQCKKKLNVTTVSPFVMDHEAYRPVSLSVPYVKRAETVSVSSIGTGYSTATGVTTAAITGVGTGLTLSLIDNGSGGISSVTILNGGTHYEVGDQLQIVSGNLDAVLTVDSISTSKTISVTLTSHGYLTDDLVEISSILPEYSGEFLITKIDDNTFTYVTTEEVTVLTDTGISRRELKTCHFRFANRKIDLGLFFGQSRTNFLQDEGFVSSLGGHSYGVIKINEKLVSTYNKLNDYDEIRIYHANGTRTDSNGKFDLITATETYSLIPNPGEYYIYNDFDNVLGYDEFYMNGNGTTSQVAATLTKCINGIRNRTFTAYNYNDRVFIKFNMAGDFDASHSISFTSPTSDYEVVTINDDYTGSALPGNLFSFMGGSKEVGNRLIIESGHLSKIQQNLNSILVKTSDSWSKIKKVSKYVDEINEANSSTSELRSSTLANYDGKIALVLAENETPIVTGREFLMRPMFRPSFGLLSFYLIKDLDFDFYSSTYTNFPNIDLYQHYFIPEGVSLLEPGISYVVYGGVIIVDDGSIAGLTYSANSVFTVAALTSYTIKSGTPLVTYSEESPSVSDRTIPLNDKNGELTNFGGFSILKDPSKVVPQDTSKSYLLKDKYLNGLTETEYDFYKENESLDFALRSKMIPYITKWGIKNGKDTRDNPYRLNTEIVFGRNNFSPDHEDRTQNPINFTHEWFYVESKFNYVLDDSLLAQNSNYFDVPFDEAQLLSDPEYFINYFTYTPTSSSGKEVADTQFRYSSLFKNSAGQYEAFFKGFKVSFKDVTEPNVLGADGKPVAKNISNRFDGYKFSCILKPIQEEIENKEIPPIKYRVIEHTDYKFIVVVIELYIGSIAQIDDYWKDDLLFSGIQVDNTNFDDSTGLITASKYSNSINGDYRIQFDANAVSSLTHTLIYSLKNKKYNTLLNSFSTIKMGSKLNISPSGVNPIDGTIAILPNILTPNYSGTLKDDIIKPNESTLVFFKDATTGFDIYVTRLENFTIPGGASINPIDFSLEKFAHYPTTGIDFFGSPVTYQPGLITSPSTLYGTMPTSNIATISNNFAFKVLTGGEGYFEKIFEKISFAKFKKQVNSLDPIIEYYSYSLDSNKTSVLQTAPKFYLEIPDISKVEKINQVIAIETDSIPIQFSGQKEIGVGYEVADLPVRYELNRYRGEYEPLVKNYSIYQSNYSFLKNPINDLSLSNTKINAEVSNLLTIQNFNHIKVADSQILELESDDSYLPIYPKINEVAIGQADYFMLRGNWDWGFHHKYRNKENFFPVSGAKRIEEDDSFLAKLITLPEYIELENFKIETIDPATEFSTIDTSKIEIAVKETRTSIEGIINVNNVLTRFLIEDGIANKFNEYLINSDEFIGNFNKISDPDLTISSYVREYIKLNILKLYDIDVNEFYTKPNSAIIATNTQAGSNPNSIEFVSLNDSQRFYQGYKILKSLQINKKDKLILSFNFAKSPSTGLMISPKIKIKFI